MFVSFKIPTQLFHWDLFDFFIDQVQRACTRLPTVVKNVLAGLDTKFLQPLDGFVASFLMIHTIIHILNIALVLLVTQVVPLSSDLPLVHCFSFGGMPPLKLSGLWFWPELGRLPRQRWGQVYGNLRCGFPLENLTLILGGEPAAPSLSSSSLQ